MKKIVRGNDFTMRVHVYKMIDGERRPMSLPSCDALHVCAVGRFRRYELAVRVDAKDDSVLYARVEGDMLPLGEYALEVKGKLFGNDWRSNEYARFALVDSNEQADTEFNHDAPDGGNSVEMGAAVVFLPPDMEVTEITSRFKAETLAAVKAETQRLVREYKEATDAEVQRVTAESKRKEAETERADAEGMRATAEHGRRTAEQGRATAEAERITAESARTAAERERTRDEHTRGQAEQERVRAESARAEAERGRLTAEATRTEKEAERVKASAHLEELLEFVKRGDYADDVKVVNAIMNAPKDPTHDVWLDSTDGQVKCTEAEGKLPITAYKFYHIGKRLVKRDNHGNIWKGNPHVRYLDLRDWDMTLCTDAGLLFYGWTSLISLDVSNWDLSALKSGYNMFSNCSSLRGLDTSKWELGNLTSAQQMFANCSSLRGLDTSKWELGNLTSMYLMFYGCYSLERLDFRSANFGNVTDANRTFEACDNLTELWLPLTFSKLTSLDLTIRTWGRTPKGLESLRWTFGEGAMDRTAKGLGACMVKLAASTYDRLTDDERAAAAKKGWTITK